MSYNSMHKSYQQAPVAVPVSVPNHAEAVPLAYTNNNTTSGGFGAGGRYPTVSAPLASSGAYPISQGAAIATPSVPAYASNPFPVQQAYAPPTVQSTRQAFDRAYFAAYRACLEEIGKLKDVPSLQHSVDNQLSSKNSELKDVKLKLKRNRSNQVRLSKRLHRNEHPRFLHYLQFNRSKKVEKLKHDSVVLESSEASMAEAQHATEDTLKSLESHKRQLADSRNRLENLKSNERRMFNNVVDTTPPTPRLQQIQYNQRQQQDQIQRETTLLQQIDNVVMQARQAVNLYEESMRMLQQAQSSNQAAAVMNWGDDRGWEYAETAAQANRDQLINAAQQPASQGALCLSQAWSSIPQEARVRFTSLTAQIGETPMPQLRGANFGNTLGTKFVFGDFGDAMNGMHASNKIHENMQIVQTCIQIASRQLSLIMTLRSAVDASLQSMQSNLHALDGQEAEEKRVIFLSVESAAR